VIGIYVYLMETFSFLICCTSCLIFQNQWLEIVLRTPQHHDEAWKSLIARKRMTAMFLRSPLILFLIKKVHSLHVSLLKHQATTHN